MVEETALIKEEDRFIMDSAKELLKKRWEKNKKLLEKAKIIKLRKRYEDLRLDLAVSYGFNREEIGSFSKEELEALDEFLVFKAKKFRRNFLLAINCGVPFLSVAGALIFSPLSLTLSVFLALNAIVFQGDPPFRFLTLRKKLQKLDEKGGLREWLL